jgi:hypothetical protein
MLVQPKDLEHDTIECYETEGSLPFMIREASFSGEADVK